MNAENQRQVLYKNSVRSHLQINLLSLMTSNYVKHVLVTQNKGYRKTEIKIQVKCLGAKEKITK